MRVINCFPKPRPRLPQGAAVVSAAAALIFLSGPAYAKTGVVTEMMRGLDSSVRDISDGIEKSDSQLVIKGAKSVADRPNPSFFTMLKVLAGLGGSVTEFKKRDEQMRTIAREISMAAKLGRLDEAAKGLQRLRGVCAKCHSKYGAGDERKIESIDRGDR